MRNRDGFTLIELLVVIALAAVLATVSFLSLSGSRASNDLQRTGEEVAAAFRNTRQRSMSQENGTAWGMHFSNATSGDTYTSFGGVTYASSTSRNAYTLGNGILFGNPPTSTSVDVLFNPLTGYPAESQIVSLIDGRKDGLVYDIAVNSLGSVEGKFWQGLVGYWPLDEGTGTTAYDASGDGYNGSFAGSPSWVSGKIGNAVNCGNTTGDYINVNSVPLGSVWTITAWFQYPLSTTGASWHTLTRGSSYDHQIIVQRSDNQLGMYDNKTGTGFNGTGYIMSNLSNGWHFIASVGSGGVEQFYIDGSYVGQTAHQSTSDVKSIGNYWGGSQNWGVVDDVRIYNRALSAQDIQDLYNETQ